MLHTSDLENVLDGGFDEYLQRSKERLGRVIELSMIERESFVQEDIYELLERYGAKVDSIALERSLQRLELSFVLHKHKGRYRYRVPLFVTKLREDIADFEKKLTREIEEFKEYKF